MKESSSLTYRALKKCHFDSNWVKEFPGIVKGVVKVVIEGCYLMIIPEAINHVSLKTIK